MSGVNNMTTKQLVEKRIRELVPKTMENPWTEIVKAGIEDLKVCEDDNYKQFLGEQVQRAIQAENDFDGIELQLHHVLEAIKQSRKGKLYAQSLSNSMAVTKRQNDEVLLFISIWDLSKPLSEQSDEVQEFIWGVIK